MVSKAADISKQTTVVSCKLSIDSYMLSKTQSSAVSVEWPVRCADCSGLKLPDESRCGLRLTSLSMSFEMVDKFEIGRGWDRSAPDFLRSGSTCASLNLVGNWPCSKDRFARWAIIGAKISAQDLEQRSGQYIERRRRRRFVWEFCNHLQNLSGCHSTKAWLFWETITDSHVCCYSVNHANAYLIIALTAQSDSSNSPR